MGRPKNNKVMMARVNSNKKVQIKIQIKGIVKNKEEERAKTLAVQNKVMIFNNFNKLKMITKLIIHK